MVTIDGRNLTLDDIAAVAGGARVAIAAEPSVRERVQRSQQWLHEALEAGHSIYGVTTLFGGMADRHVGREQLADLQRIALWHHRSTTGPLLPAADVRAAMLLRANSLLRGVSGIRMELIERYVAFLNGGATPRVHQHGSIGASGDLVPLSYIGGAVVGLHPDFLVEIDGECLDSHAALARLGLAPVALLPKEGLALNNGTGASTGIAALCTCRALDALALTVGIHALFAQALVATSQSFDAFIHEHKPHPGQVRIAREMAALVAGSRLIRDEATGDRSSRRGSLIQDRYSLRCLPQYLGPVVEALDTVARQIETEANSANDNPLIDAESRSIYHTGNFLAQYTGVAMDQLRFQISMLAQHLDAQIALLVAPEHSGGLPPSLVGNEQAGVNVGLKSLQIVGNALVPLIAFYGQPIVDRYPTHADQYNQNINSQAMNAANLARESLDRFEHYLANALVFAVQAVELRAARTAQAWDARGVLSTGTRELYAAAREAAGGAIPAGKPLVWDDLDDSIQRRVEGVLENLQRRGTILQCVAGTRERLRA